jgi:hypothetical protein
MRALALLLAASCSFACSLDEGGTLFDDPADDDGLGDTSASAGAGATAGGTGAAGPTSASGSGGAVASSGSGAGGGDGPGGKDPGGNCGQGGPPANDDCYWEDVCPDALLDDLVQAYSPGNWYGTSVEMTARRYPSASCLIEMYQNDVGNYADASSFGSLATSLMTMVHEETHGYDYEHALWGSTFSYYLRCDLALETPWLDGFARSEILAHVQGQGTALYDGTYLTGQQGTYGLVELLDEWNAYLNGMAAIGLVGDHVDVFGISGTDGALAFAYYLELYLRVARTEHPAVYDEIKATPAIVELLRVQWNRMHFFLELAQAYDKLSIHADEIAEHLYAADNLAELEMVIGTPLSASNCN